MPTGIYKDRAAWIYFGSKDHLDEVREAAKTKDLALSAYVCAACEAFSKPREVSSLDVNQLRDQLRKAESDLRAKDMLLAKQAEDLRRLQDTEFAKDSWDADINSELIALLQSPIHEHQIFSSLGAKDVAAMQAISRQLHILEKEGFATKNARGWQWKK